MYRGWLRHPLLHFLSSPSYHLRPQFTLYLDVMQTARLRLRAVVVRRRRAHRGTGRRLGCCEYDGPHSISRIQEDAAHHWVSGLVERRKFSVSSTRGELIGICDSRADPTATRNWDIGSARPIGVAALRPKRPAP